MLQSIFAFLMNWNINWVLFQMSIMSLWQYSNNLPLSPKYMVEGCLFLRNLDWYYLVIWFSCGVLTVKNIFDRILYEIEKRWNLFIIISVHFIAFLLNCNNSEFFAFLWEFSLVRNSDRIIFSYCLLNPLTLT